MLPDAVDLRVHVYDHLLERGMPPTLDELARHFGCGAADAKRALAELKIGKTVLAHPQTGEIWMAGPFAATESPYRVTGSRVTWFANCAWDMLGVAVIANERVRIEARCTDCGEDLSMSASPSEPPSIDAVVHFLVPARRWYDDLGFT